MLTKDLILCKTRGGVVYPQFLPSDHPEWQALSEQLLAAYDVPMHPTRGEIEEITTPLVTAASKLWVAKGILKTIDDRAEFSAPQEIDYASERMRLFKLSAELLRSGHYETEELFHQALRERSSGSALADNASYFADLPENDRLTGMTSMNVRQVIERYNVGLVQGLLLRASSLTIDVSDEEPARIRRLFKYLKFFRLLAGAEKNGANGGIRLTVDGPASILEQSKRYGVQLANFFPAVCSLKHWRILADVEWKEHPAKLKLDETSGLVCPYHNFIAYAPEEIQLFERHFKDTVVSWKLLDDTPCLEGMNRELFFPDFVFQNDNGKVLYLELFHRWHSTPLKQRLDYCEAHPELPLLIGIDRTLLKDPELEERVNASSWFAGHGFLFRDYPTVEKTVNLLDNALIS